MDKLLGYYIFLNPVLNYFISLLIFIITLKLLYYLRDKLFDHLENIAKKTKTDLDDLLVNIVKKIKWPEYQLFALYIATRNLRLPEWFSYFIKYAVIILITVRATVILNEIIEYWLKRITSKEYEKSVAIVKNIITVIIWIIAALFILNNLGIKVGALLTGAGIGGVAIALASQNILGDAFNFFVLMADKPFKIGDFIVVESLNIVGTVEEIGLKSVKIRSLWGEIIKVSNSKIAGEVIKNYTRMEKRVIKDTVGVIYETPIEKLKIIPDIIKQAIEKNGCTCFRANLIKFNSYSIDFEYMYQLPNPDYNFYTNTNEKILRDIAVRFKEENIEFAYPTQKLFVTQEN